MSKYWTPRKLRSNQNLPRRCQDSKVSHNVEQCSSSSTSVSFSPVIARVTDLETTSTEGVASSSRKGKKKKSKDQQKDLELNEDSDSGLLLG